MVGLFPDMGGAFVFAGLPYPLFQNWPLCMERLDWILAADGRVCFLVPRNDLFSAQCRVATGLSIRALKDARFCIHSFGQLILDI